MEQGNEKTMNAEKAVEKCQKRFPIQGRYSSAQSLLEQSARTSSSAQPPPKVAA
jgi:hypothetical protein